MSDNDEKMLYSSNNDTEENTSNVSGEFMIAVDEDYGSFQKLINQNLAIESNLEKELAKEDKKCTFLRHKIESIRKEASQSEKINVELREYIYNQQMEIEQISSSISEQSTELKIMFPDERVSYYSSAVSILINMIDYVKNFEVALKNMMERCNENDAEVKTRAKAVEKVLNRIYELQEKTTDLKNADIKLKRTYLKYDFHSIQRNISLLNEKFDEYLKVKHNSMTANIEISEFQRQLQKCTDRNERVKNSNLAMSKSIDRISGMYSKKTNFIKKEGIDIESEYCALLKEYDCRIKHIYERIKIFEDQIVCKNENLDQLLSQEVTCNRTIDELSSQLINTETKYHKSVTQKNAINEQENYLLKMKSAIEQQLNTLESNERKVMLDQQIQDNSLLRDEVDVSAVERQKTSLNVHDLRQMITKEENDINALETLVNQQYKHDVVSHKEMAEELLDKRDKKKTKLIMRQMESSSLEVTIKNLKEKLAKEHAKRIAEINRKLNESRDNSIELSNAVIEKRLFTDSLRDDAEFFNNQCISMQHTIWLTDQEAEKLNDVLKRFNDEISNKTTDCKNKQKLLRDLKRNSFPRTEIPKDWFKSFEKQKREYEQFLKEKLILEKRRNKLIIALDSDGFQGSQSGAPSKNEDSVGLRHGRFVTPSMKEEPKKILLQEVAKDALFRVFKEKVEDKKLLVE